MPNTLTQTDNCCKFFKLHSLSHYITYIRLFGPPDNYDSQMYERLHKLLKELFRVTNSDPESSTLQVHALFFHNRHHHAC